jgi:hypothetical protein
VNIWGSFGQGIGHDRWFEYFTNIFYFACPESGFTPDPTPFFYDYKDAKKIFFSDFSYNLPMPTGTSSSV